MTETVLCIKKELLPESWVQQKSVVPLNLDLFIKNCSIAGFKFIDRPDAEKSTSYKQIIPYIILQTRDLKKLLFIIDREVNKDFMISGPLESGGHINPVDRKKESDSFEKILMSGMERELKEELYKRPEGELPSFIGVISENITDVGKVHLGAVFRILTDSPENFLPGQELFQFSWEKTKTLDRLNLELWSTLSLDLISAQLRI